MKGFAEDAHFWIPKEGGVYYPNPRRTAIYKEQIQIYKKVYDMAVSVWEQAKSYKIEKYEVGGKDNVSINERNFRQKQIRKIMQWLHRWCKQSLMHERRLNVQKN